ncbi:MAG: hypothetical protein NNA20_06070 [Nitrospira sp.]|nr:hypothetical protein [Nitrospira sp.]MCP9442142.1 hypothetical protein [Nitrospira sp.]
MNMRIDMAMGALSVMVALTAVSVWAEPLSVQDREAIMRLGATQGHSETEITSLLEHVNKAGERGLPTDSLLNKVREGLAKGIEPRRIDLVLRQMTSRLESAHEVLEEAKGRGIAEGNRQRALETLAEAFARGATVDEVRELSRLSQEGRHKVTQDELAAGAKGVAVMKEGRIPSKDGMALVSEGIKQGYRAVELLDLSREVKRRGADFERDPASLNALREQISRGERRDRLFKDEDRNRSGGGDRNERGGRDDRKDRDDRHDSARERVDRSDRSGRGDRPERIERSDKVERPDRADRSGRGRD